MHPRNVYAGQTQGDVDWKDENARRKRTQELLKRDFGVECEFASDRLCPALPNRLNYLHWVEDLVAAMPRPANVCGVDVGTGHAAIFAVLMCAMHRSWHMVGTDIDQEALDLAKSLCAAPSNRPLGLSERIQLVHTRDTLLPDVDAMFTVCNPPFYTCAQERDALREAKEPYYEPCVGHDVELYTEGGEVAFVERLVQESAEPMHRERIAWYTSMLGRLASVHAIVSALKREGITNYALTDLVQGRTRRWAIAWSFRPERVPDRVARHAGSSLHACMPLANTRTWHVALPSDEALYDQLKSLDTLPPSQVELAHAPLTVTVWTPCWTRTARRARARGEAEPPRAAYPLVRLEFTVDAHQCIYVSWTYGHDRDHFDSLCQHILGRLRSCGKRVAT